MEVIPTKVVLTVEEANEIKALLWRLAYDGQGSYELNRNDVELAKKISEKLHNLLIGL